MASDMNTAADALEFETAARLRDRIAALSAIQGAQGVNPRTVEEADVFALVEEGGHFAIEVFFFRTYQNWGNRTYFPRADRSLSGGEVLDAFLAQFYEDKPAPRCVLLSHDIENLRVLELALAARMGRKVEVCVPKRGERRELVEHAEKNARETLARKLADASAQEKLLIALATAFGIDKKLRRVEIYDNSHIMGTNAVGGMVVAGANGFMKSHYRTFNIKDVTLTPGDDYGMMREVLSRRFARLKKEEAEGAAPADSESFPSRPDLILIDGGKGQFEAARQTLAELGVEGVEIIGIAKGPDRDAGRETFFAEGREAFKLLPRDPALYFSGCATKHIVSPSARIARGAKKTSPKARLTRLPASAPRASGRCFRRLARRKRFHAPPSPTWRKRPASTPRRPSSYMIILMSVIDPSCTPGAQAPFLLRQTDDNANRIDPCPRPAPRFSTISPAS